jgi:tricorn protease-like protein
MYIDNVEIYGCAANPFQEEPDTRSEEAIEKEEIQLAGSIDLEVYPIPTNSNLNIDLNPVLGHKGIIFIYDMNGKILNRFAFDEGHGPILELDLSNLDAGIYLMKVNSDSFTTKTKRIVIAR